MVATLHRRWRSGRYLRAHARGEPFEPIRLVVKGPTASELLDRFEAIRTWAASFEADAGPALVVEHRILRGRNVGANRVPARVRVDSLEQLCQLLGTGAEVDQLDGLLRETRRRLPALVRWAVEHPVALLEHRSSWSAMLDTVEWVAANDTRSLYLRQVDVEGVDTKFLERHQRLLVELLVLVLPEEGAPSTGGSTGGPAGDPPGGPPGLGVGPGLVGRFGFRAKPSYTRLRVLDPSRSPLPDGISEATLRTQELAKLDPGVDTVFIVENEVSYLSFPEVTGAIAVFGSGFASSTLADLPWLSDKDVVYWGDIDTHGLGILSRLRSLLPEVRSILMDHETLLAHRQQWVTEPTPTRRPLDHLTEAEQTLYRDLITDRYGAGVRLEQERVRFSRVRDALAPWL